jgi:hypothetical protein
MRFPRARFIFIAAALAGLAGALVAGLRVRSSVDEALLARSDSERSLTFAPLAPTSNTEHWASADVDGIALSAEGLLTAGAFGVDDGTGGLHSGLPTLHAAAVALWRERPVVGLTAGGLFRRVQGRWEEARTGFGLLHVRCLAESPAGDLWIGAREGLFRAPFSAARMQRVDRHPVRALALEAGLTLAAGEEGLRLIRGREVVVVTTADPWVESVGLVGDRVFAVTATGLEVGDLGSPLAPAPGGEDVVQGLAYADRFYALTASPATLRRIEASGAAMEERVPARPRRVLASNGVLFVDSDEGLWRRDSGGFVLLRPRIGALPGGRSHVTALARLGDTLVAGFFDGGLAVADGREARLAWRDVAGSAAWGVNALLPAGGVVYVASLRGAARFDGRRLTPVDGPGPAFSLASSDDGVAIGYAQGVLLPGSKLLSAFHGLPGNQALALASGDALFVGTPSGLGAVRRRRVAWRATSSEGALPHPWVTALHLAGDVLYVGTYGGGVVRRTGAGRYEPFVETESLKINAGCLAEAGGRLYAGTDGRGLWRLSEDKTRFEPLRGAWLPSPRITALLADEGALYVGTDEGLARLPVAAGEKGGFRAGTEATD